MRVLVVIATLVTALAFVGTSAADAPVKVTSIQATLTGTGCGITGTVCSGNCCLRFWTFSGRGTIAPPLGSLRFTASLVKGDDPFALPPIGIRSLTLTLVSGNGDQLVLDENATWPTTNPVPPPTWTVDHALSTGRFAVFTGSGSYSDTDLGCGSTDSSGNCTSEQFSVALSGTLTATR